MKKLLILAVILLTGCITTGEEIESSKCIVQKLKGCRVLVCNVKMIGLDRAYMSQSMTKENCNCKFK